MTLDYYQREGSDFEHVGSVTAEGEIVAGESHAGVQGLAGDLQQESISPVDALLLHSGYNARIVDTRPVEEIPDAQLKRLDGPDPLTHGGSADIDDSESESESESESDTPESDTPETDTAGTTADTATTSDTPPITGDIAAHKRLDSLLDRTDGLTKAGNPHRLLATHTDPYPIDAVMLATKQTHDLSWISKMERACDTNAQRRRYIAHSTDVTNILKSLITGADAYTGL